MATKPKTIVNIATARKKRGVLFGQNLRELRVGASLTLTELAQQCNLAASTLSKIENGQMSPTYDTLAALAEGLRVDIADLVSSERGKSVNGRRAITRKGQGIKHTTEQYAYEMLCNDIANRQFVPLLAEITARSVKSFDGLLSHPGEEFVFVLFGKVELHTELYAPSILEVGDSCYFDSTMGHAIVNLTDESAKVLWISSYVTGALRN